MAYLLYVPTSHRFCRYLVPALPGVALLGLAMLREWAHPGPKTPAFAWSSSRGRIAAVALIALVAMQGADAPAADQQYRDSCRHYHQYHEAGGRWLAAHTAPTAVIATHDVGAIAYDSNRRILDVVGLIQPEVIPYLHKPEYTSFLAQWFARQHVTHLALLENWMEVANQEPLWTAGQHPEMLSVYAWVPGRTLLVPEQVSALNRWAADAAKAGALTQAMSALQQSLALEPRDSRTWYLLGAVRAGSGDAAGADSAYQAALRLFPEYDEAREGLRLLGESAARGEPSRPPR